MKKIKQNKIIWLFFSLALFSFLAALLIFFDLPGFKINPLKSKSLSYQFILDEEQLNKEKLIDWMILLNKGDNNVYLWAGDYYEKKGDLERAVAFYQKAINYAPLLSFETYKKQLEIYKELEKEEERESLLLFLFKKIEGKGYLLNFSANLSKELYSIGEEYLEQGDWQETAFWWEKTTIISPEWSYFYLELASLYYQNSQLEKAREMMQRCINRKEPSEHCQTYLDLEMAQFENERPGFWQKEILLIKDDFPSLDEKK